MKETIFDCGFFIILLISDLEQILLCFPYILLTKLNLLEQMRCRKKWCRVKNKSQRKSLPKQINFTVNQTLFA